MEEKKLIALSVNPEGKLWNGHFGMASFYYVYNREGNLLEKRENPYSAKPGVKHEHHDDPNLIVAFLADCSTFIARRMGEESRRKLASKLGVETVLTKEKEPELALKEYLNQK